VATLAIVIWLRQGMADLDPCFRGQAPKAHAEPQRTARERARATAV